MVSRQPSATKQLTFLMTDVEGSTRMWEEHPDLAGGVIERHDEVIEGAVAAHGGVLVRSKGEGDSTFSVFEDASAAVTAALDLQRGLHREQWPAGCQIRVRAAIYTGPAEVRGGDFHGIAPNRGGRLRAIAHGGQTLCSETTHELVAASTRGSVPSDVSLRDLGLHRLRDLARAERVFQVVHPDLPREFPPLRSLGVRHNLPASRTTFVGRHVEQAAVQKHLEVERLVTLTGVGGCGKTRLALEVAAERLEQFPDGVFFVDLAPVPDAAVLPAAVAAAIGFSRLALGTESGDPASELIEYLAAREVLLVIDNCEHLIEPCAALIDEILERCLSVSVLATSREALDLPGEQVYPVPPLGLSDHSPIDSDAAQLFAARASLVQPGYSLTATEAPAVEEICRRLDGIPLAIELAAAQTAQLTTGQIVERLDDRFRLLAGGRGRGQRQQTLHAALDWSHDLLSDDQRVVLRRLAVFPGSFSVDASEAVCGAPGSFDVVRSLVKKSLVVTEDDGTARRFRLLETVRAYAEERLVESGEGPSIRDRHRDFFLTWVEAIPPELTYLDPQGAIRLERDNLRGALSWSEAQGRRDLVGRLAGTMNRLWIADISEGKRWISIGLDAVDELEREHRVRLLAVAAHVAVLAMEAYDGELARRAVAAADGQPGVWSSLAHSLLCLNAGVRGFWTKDSQCSAEVERLGRLAVELAPEALSRGLSWFWLGQARVLLDDLDGAIAALEQGSAEVIPGGDMSPVTLAMLAGTLHVRGRHDDALAAATAVFERAKSFNNSGLWAWVLYSSLPYALELSQHGRDAEAVAFLRDLLEDGITTETPGVMTSVVIVLAGMAELRGDLATAGVLLEHAGTAMMHRGIRTPVDIALYSHYLQKVAGRIDDDVASAHRERAAEMTFAEVIALGLERP